MHVTSVMLIYGVHGWYDISYSHRTYFIEVILI